MNIFDRVYRVFYGLLQKSCDFFAMTKPATRYCKQIFAMIKPIIRHCEEGKTQRSNPLKAFTLAEIMIVLGVIGIITAVLLPAARQATPDEDVIKFKKAHNTFATVIRELVTSDKYYMNGDLGIKSNGDLIDGTHSGDYEYLCLTMADIVSTKTTYCSDTPYGISTGGWVDTLLGSDSEAKLDSQCKKFSDPDPASASPIQIPLYTNNIGVILPDGTVFYEYNSGVTFGMSINQAHLAIGGDGTLTDFRNFGGYATSVSHNTDPIYKILCIDIDGVGRGEAPFGYGVRADGKILNGARAQQWLEKSIQGEED